MGEVSFRCSRKEGLVVCQKLKCGGYDLDNAIVFCENCLIVAVRFRSLPIQDETSLFSDVVRKIALIRAGGRCECTLDFGCH